VEYSNKPLILVDSSCVVHKLIDLQLRGAEKKVVKLTNKKRDEIIRAGIDYYSTAFMFLNLNRSNCDILFSGDAKEKPYWRFDYLKEWFKSLPEEEHNKLSKDILRGYKGTRTNCQYRLWCQKRFFSFSNSLLVPGYESDDIIAAIVKIVDGKRPIIVLTVDSDLSGLISDSKRVLWACLTGFNPPIRDEKRLQSWMVNKLSKESAKGIKLIINSGISLDKPNVEDLWKWKILMGDRSDNLPANSPPEMIDLFNPPNEFKLWENKEFLDNWENYIKPVTVDKDGDIEEDWYEKFSHKKITPCSYLPEAFTGD
jgi:hypothetical protein